MPLTEKQLFTITLKMCIHDLKLHYLKDLGIKPKTCPNVQHVFTIALVI